MIPISDTQLHVADRGRGPVLLLVHGFPLDHTMWRYQLDELSSDYRVVAPDLRGFGHSGPVEGTLTMQQLADDLAELLDALQIVEPIVLCGLSMGGYVAWQFWRRHAARLGGLILCDTRAGADTQEAARGRLSAARIVLKEGPSILVNVMLPKLFAPGTCQRQAELVEPLRQTMLQTAPASIAAALRGMAERPDMTPVLGQIDVPTLVVCGQHDVISPRQEMQAIAQSIRRAEYVQIHGAGHMSPLEQPAQVNTALRNFLRSVFG